MVKTTILKTALFLCSAFLLNLPTGNAQVADVAENIAPLLIGERIPDAQLKDTDGKEVSLLQVFTEKPTVLVFYRGGWCPYCNAQLSALAKTEAEILKLGYQIVAVSPDNFKNLRPTIETDQLHYQVFSDGEAKLIKQIGIAFRTPEKAMSYIMEKTGNEAAEALPVPSVFVVDKKGKILFEYLNPDYKTRMSPELLMAVLKAL